MHAPRKGGKSIKAVAIIPELAINRRALAVCTQLLSFRARVYDCHSPVHRGNLPLRVHDGKTEDMKGPRLRICVDAAALEQQIILGISSSERKRRRRVIAAT